jgi:hypothetical protein
VLTLAHYSNSINVRSIDRILAFIGILQIRNEGGLFAERMGLSIIAQIFIARNMMRTQDFVRMGMSKLRLIIFLLKKFVLLIFTPLVVFWLFYNYQVHFCLYVIPGSLMQFNGIHI